MLEISLYNLDDFDARDIKYALLLVGQYLKNKYLGPFRELISEDPAHLLSLTQILGLLQQNSSKL